MNKTTQLLICITIITVCIACNATPADDDSNSDTDLIDDTEFDVFGNNNNAGDDWPGQQIDEAPLGYLWDMPEAEEGLKILVANVGNIDFYRCADVAYNLCWTEQEEVITAQIASREADIILLQEVLAPKQCDALEDDNIESDHVCHPAYRPDEPEQVRRLVGPDFTIACDDRGGYECVATRVGTASISGCADGTLCRGHARTGEPIDGCDPGFTVSAVTVEFDDRRLDVVNVHPPSNSPTMPDPKQCRHDYFLTFFGQDAELIEHDDIFVGGDFNFDPYRAAPEDVDVALWHHHVSTSFDDSAHDPFAFAYHSGLPEHDPPYHTSPLIGLTLDHVISNSLFGRCKTLGAHPGEPPLDKLHGDPINHLDHLAIECILK